MPRSRNCLSAEEGGQAGPPDLGGPGRRGKSRGMLVRGACDQLPDNEEAAVRGETGALDCAEVINWRKAERQRLIAERLAIPGDIRRRHADHIAASLDEVIGEVRGRVISAYWPFRGEPDLRGFMGRVLSRAGRC